ncbi:hypothetical protein TVAG_128640 [Trichomonas vaginalis G3]|uniref:Uncharacterized protein n=1 Tax=Trichomonas vaginalis (strain ATCC PRA-98 / G3) TaxID=412133 RepID=A2E4B5_TRIV3|nr:hypothetical protein TVAGG3_0018250 [Trichomonas vaginalis G3]EAY12450.1 hypothetical protein TVAG_128640 [Trichomonas vaginalis G3]KAI5539510.1 hypothetical protein TVAGG3_0018250 [Trichomonas vaginalis G3]|eukprot:XP_001324673.1 hypothetical protein [Trichomonas vaginalis G3]
MKTLDANMKDIVVLQDDIPVYKGTLNVTTGHILNIKKPDNDENAPHDVEKLIEPTFVTDNYGIIPFFRRTKKVSIKIWSSYNNSPKWGVSHFKLFDYQGKEFDYHQGITIRVENSGILESIDLFNKDNITQGDLNPGTEITFNFENSVHIGAMLIYNYYDANIKANYGICHCSIYFNQQLQWVGKIPMRVFNQEKWKPTDPMPIFFVDGEGLQDRVYGQF